MSLHPATADRWVGDLEDILGLQPVPRSEPVAGKRAKTRSVLSPTSLGIVVACVAVVAVGIEVDRRGLPTDLARRFAGRTDQTTRVVPPSSSARTAGTPALPGRGEDADEGRDAANADATLRGTLDDRSVRSANLSGSGSVGSPSRRSTAATAAPGPARPGRERRPPSAGGRATMSADRPPAPGRAPDDASGSNRTLAGAGVAAAARPKGALPADGFDTPAFAASPQPAFPPLAGAPQEAPVPARSDANGLNSARKTEAIDALRTLRRQ